MPTIDRQNNRLQSLYCELISRYGEEDEICHSVKLEIERRMVEFDRRKLLPPYGPKSDFSKKTKTGVH